MFFSLWWIELNVSPIRSKSSPPEQYSRKRYIVGPSFRCPKNRTMLAWLSIYWTKVHTEIHYLLSQCHTQTRIFAWVWCSATSPTLWMQTSFLTFSAQSFAWEVSITLTATASSVCLFTSNLTLRPRQSWRWKTTQPQQYQSERSCFILHSRWCWNIFIYCFKRSSIESYISSLNHVAMKMSMLYDLWKAFHIIQ